MPKRGGQTGPHRANRKRFPYEPQLVGGEMINGHRLDAEDRRVVGLAFEMVCITLRVGDCDEGLGGEA